MQAYSSPLLIPYSSFLEGIERGIQGEIKKQEIVREQEIIMATRHTTLPFEAKTYIVSALACCEKPRYILAKVEENWGIKLHPKSLNHYHPERNPRLDAELMLLWDYVRCQFSQERAAAAMNHLAFRQHQRYLLYNKCGSNVRLQIRILGDAAKDAGGLFTGINAARLEQEAQTLKRVDTLSRTELASFVKQFHKELGE